MDIWVVTETDEGPTLTASPPGMVDTVFEWYSLLVDDVLDLPYHLLAGVDCCLPQQRCFEEQGVRVAELDCPESDLDDVESFVIPADLELVIPEVEDSVDGLGEEGTVGIGDELDGVFLGSQDDGASLACDGVDPEMLGESHPCVRVSGEFLGREGGNGGGGDGERDEGDDAFHMSVDFRCQMISDDVSGFQI